jgi:hypothetical protein
MRFQESLITQNLFQRQIRGILFRGTFEVKGIFKIKGSRGRGFKGPRELKKMWERLSSRDFVPAN